MRRHPDEPREPSTKAPIIKDLDPGMDTWILRNKRPVRCWDMKTWAKFMGTEKAMVVKTIDGEITISTVFLGINHNFSKTGKPVLFETMIFGGEHDQECWRYKTWAEAEEGHKKAVNLVRGIRTY